MKQAPAMRWLLIGVVVLSSALNYLDRMVLAALAPTIQTEFHLTTTEYGYLLTAFSLVYALTAPVMGLLIDRTGLVAGAAIVVAIWSFAGTTTGLVTSFTTLMLCRAFLGLGEAGGVPATGKAFAQYLEPKDRAIGTGLNQLGLTIGASAAPLLVAWSLRHANWRFSFIVAGLLGFVWIAVWIVVARNVPSIELEGPDKMTAGEIVRDRRFAALIIANALCMTVYSLWTNWTTLFLVTRHSLPADVANQRYAWIPPIFATAGALAGGWLARSLISRGVSVARTRLRVSLLGALLVLTTAAAPLVPSPALATMIIAAGLFAVTCMSVNYYAVPLDIFGPSRAAFAVSALTGSFGLMQAFVSPIIGHWRDQFGWEPACYTVAALPLVSVAVLQLALRPR
jgi:MFS transporter, ACS family, hexuronate transporter